MIDRLVAISIDHRWLVVIACIAAVAFGARSLVRLPIDAVPDITNNQVQINTLAPALSPVEIEKQVTFRIETALAGAAGLEYTRSLSRNGFSQVTAVFSDKTNIYFARQQIGERLLEVRSTLPPGAEPKMGPVSTGLGEIYMWSVAYGRPGERYHDGDPGWQRNGSYLTPEGQLSCHGNRTIRIFANDPGLDHPAADQERAGSRGRRFNRRVREAVSRSTRPGEADRAWLVFLGPRPGDRKKQPEPRRGLYRAQWRRIRRARRRARRIARGDRTDRRRHTRRRPGSDQGPRKRIGRR